MKLLEEQNIIQPGGSQHRKEAINLGYAPYCFAPTALNPMENDMNKKSKDHIIAQNLELKNSLLNPPDINEAHNT